MHPLFDNMTSLTYEELEKKNVEINKRMQMYARNRMNNPQIWDQLEQMREAILQEKQERAIKLNSAPDTVHNHVVVNTDPLEDDEVKPATSNTQNKFNPIS
jgi:alpha-D-ribose 1-methylphosphonate 5-triphosphate diphosphatase PhnM